MMVSESSQRKRADVIPSAEEALIVCLVLCSALVIALSTANTTDVSGP